MIKCSYYLKSLKQLFIISLISCFGLLGNSFVNASWEFFNANESFTVPNVALFTLRVASSSAGVLDGGGMSSPKPLIMLQSNVSNTREYRYIYFWGTDNKLYAYGNADGTPTNSSDLEYLKFNTFYRFTNTGFVNCNYGNLHNSCGSEGVSAESFYSDTSLKGSMTRFAYFFDNGNSNNYTAFCWVYDNLGFSICVKPSGSSTTSLTPVAGLSLDPVEFNENLIGFSPWIDNVIPDNPTNPDIGYNDNLDNVNTNSFTGTDLISYYENNPNFKFNKNICYIGTNDLTSLYEDGIPYYEGQGKTIFELYAHLYGQNNNTPLNEVGKFMNAWWINYATWFEGRNRNGVDDSVVYNANYSPSSGFYLTYNNLSNPFVNNLSALFFMASNITSYTPSLEAQGDEVALYCYHKLGTNNNSWINEGDEFKAYWESVGSYTVQARRNSGYFSGAESIVSQSWHGTPLDYFTGDEDLEFNTFFNKSFNRFTSVFEGFDYSNIPGLGILPWYIIVSLLGLIFFRFLSH